MAIDRRTLNLAAPVLSTVGSLIAFLSAVRNRQSIIASTLALIGSVAWSASAIQDDQEQQAHITN